MHYGIELSANNSDATSRILPKGGSLPFRIDFASRECLLCLKILPTSTANRGATVYIFLAPNYVRALALTLLLTAPSASLRTH